MIFLPSLGDALTAVDRFLIAQARDLEQATVDALVGAAGKVSPVDKIVDIGEILYSVRSDLTTNGLTIAGQIVEFATRNGWHGLTVDDRGQRMVDAVRRQLGEDHPTGGEWPDPSTDPAPKFATTVGNP